jgi:hypothetical protein
MMVKSGLEKFILKSLHAVIFVTEFEMLCKTPKKNELEENSFRMEEFLKYVF